MPTQPLPPKKEVALALLERSSVFVHLDPRLAPVVVPAGFKKQPQLVLQVGLNMPVPIRDLHVDDEGMTCTLSFNRTPFFCVVPWSSVYAIVGCDDGRGMIWPDDVPPEVAQAQARAVESVDRKQAPRGAGRVGLAPAPEPPADASDAAGSRGAPASPASPASPKPKRPRKRLQPAAGAAGVPGAPRAAVAAVASLPQSQGEANGGVPASERSGPASSPTRPTRPLVSPAPVRRAAEATGRRKRELPPYLRVVK